MRIKRYTKKIYKLNVKRNKVVDERKRIVASLKYNNYGWSEKTEYEITKVKELSNINFVLDEINAALSQRYAAIDRSREIMQSL